MSKPRLCEILGVEVGEGFEIKNRKGKFLVDNNGYLICKTEAEMSVANSIALCDAIECPGIVIHKSKWTQWTQQDIEDAKGAKRLHPNFPYVYKYANPCTVLCKGTVPFEGITIDISSKCFPSLGFCEAASIDEILDSEVKEC